MNNPQSRLLAHDSGKPARGLPLRLVLVLPFLLQIFAAVSLTGYLSFLDSKESIEDLATQLMSEVEERIDQHLANYLTVPHQINQLNKNALDLNQLDVKDLTSMERHFWQQSQIFQTVSYIQFGGIDGEFIGLGINDDGSINYQATDFTGSLQTYQTEADGDRGEFLKSSPDFDPRKRPWYKVPQEANAPAWTNIYTWVNPPTLAITLGQPYYDPSGIYQGILATDLSIAQIGNFLETLKIGQTGQAFIFDAVGMLVATSTSEKPFVMESLTPKRIHSKASTDLMTRSTAEYIAGLPGTTLKSGGLQTFQFEIDGKKHFLAISPITDPHGLKWTSAIVIPESDFMAQIHQNTRNTVLVCAAFLSISTLLTIGISRRITGQIRSLSDASLAIATGNLHQEVDLKGINELSILASTFNQMAGRLRSSFEQQDYANEALSIANLELDRNNQQLEARVKERTLELQQAKNAAETASKSKSSFLANMSHELRTPLNAVLGFTQLMQRDKSTSRSQLESLAVIERSGEHLLSLINDVLDMSKIEAGRIELNPQSFNLHRLLDTTEEMLEFKADAKNIQLLFERHPNVPLHVRTDERKLRQIIINLLNNAIKFTDEGGVTLRIKADEDRPNLLLFEIEDTGKGIKAEELDTLFEAFTQTETGRQAEEGTGLGLPISRKFVQLMGGDIVVDSVVGRGTVFKFQISTESAIAAELQNTGSKSKKVIGLKPNQPTYRILVVDDRWENRQIVLKLLEPIGFEVKEAANGREAIDIWQTWQPDLIWMDMRMPVMNGYEATKHIKSHLKGQAVYIIALTASTFEEERVIVLSTGCDDFVRKPFRQETILDKIAEYLGVEYIYEEDAILLTADSSTDSEFVFDDNSFGVMSTTWLSQLETAAGELDEEAISLLITQIPTEHSSLARAIQDKVDDFDFDDIVNSIRATASNRSQS